MCRNRFCAAIFVVIAAVLLYPLSKPLDEVDLDEITTWGLQGSGLNDDIPFMGVYFFDGLNPWIIADFSHCRWDEATLSASCPFHGPGAFAADPIGSMLEFPERFQATSFSIGIASVMLRIFSVLRYTPVFTFSEDLLTANITTSFFGLPPAQQPFREAFSAAHLQPPRLAKWCNAECHAADSVGDWRRTNHWDSLPESDSGYTFRLIMHRDGTINEANLKLAKEKLGSNKLLRNSW